MERAAFMIRLRQGAIDEYRRVHDELSTEMRALFRQAGRTNFSIWYADGVIFGYYESEDMQRCRRILDESPLMRRWRRCFNSLNLTAGGDGAPDDSSYAHAMEPVFLLE